MNILNPTQLRSQKQSASANPPAILIRLWLCLLLAIGVLGAASGWAASQTWTNAPADNYFNNTNNWVGQAVPGASNSTANADVALFTNAIPLSGIGGAGNAITNEYQRSLGGFIFDTATCGAYVFGNSINDNYLQIRGTSTITTNVVVGSAVTNPITFNEPIRFVVPSSTNLRIDITNNAASTNATLYFASITNATASTRPLSLYLSGSNTGTNTIARLDDQVAGAGAIQIFKEGAGLWILSSSNDLPQKTSAGNPAGVFVEGGTLEVKDPGSLGVITAPNLVVRIAGTLQIDGVSLINSGVTLQSGGTLKISGNSTNNGLFIGNAGGTSVTVATTTASDVLIVNTNAGGALDTVVHINGPGTVILDQVSSYLGKWSVDAGTLAVTNSAALGTGANANLNIAGGAIFDVSPLGAITYTMPGSLSASGAGTTVGSTAATIKAAGGATVSMATGAKDITLRFNPTSFSGDTTHPALYISQGTLSISGNAFIVNNVSGTALGVGTYRLVEQASGNITSGGGYAAIVLGSGLAAGTVATIQVTGGFVNLVVASYTAQNLTWVGGLNGNAWDVGSTANWTAGAGSTVFNTSDNVTFDATGAANPSVSLAATLVPGNVKVDTGSANYTFSGSGQIAGTANLTKVNSGTLLMQTVNYYRNGTVVSNGTLKVGIANAVPSQGSGDVAVVSPGVLDLNSYSDTVNALTGNGTIDNTGGGASVLTVGYNDDSGIFGGVIQNSSGTLGITKIGQGTETITNVNTYTGPTVVNAGTLKVSNRNALGSGASPVTVNAGTLDVNTDMSFDSLQGALGSVITNSTALTNTLIIGNVSTNTSTYDGMIANGTTGRLRVFVTNGTFRVDGVQNTYSNGTVMAAGTTLAVGAVSGSVATSGRPGTGDVIASNNVTISMPTGLSIAATIPNNINTVDGATVSFTSVSTGNSLNGYFNGSATATNIYTGNFSLGGTLDFSNFLGTVIFTNAAPGAGTRWFGGANHLGGTNASFILVNGANFFCRDASVVHLGSLTGSGSILGPSIAAGGCSYWIGAKGVDMEFSGYIQGSNNIVKTGIGVLTLDGGVGTNVSSPDGGITYVTNLSAAYTNFNTTGFTTVSNGILRLVVPITLTNNYNGDVPMAVTLASPTAVLDASSMGYFTYQYDSDNVTVTNILLYTNGVLEVAPNQNLSGIGTIRGSVVADVGSVLNPGYTAISRTAGVYILTNGTGTGVLNVTNSVTLSGVVNFRLNRTNAVNADELTAASFAVNPTASVTVSNVGPPLQGGEVFHLFNHPVTGFATVTLQPIAPLIWTNNLAIDGTIVVSASTNADLVGLVVTPAGTLAPVFNSNTLSYATTEAYSNSPITVTVTNANITATNRLIYNGATNIIASGTASGALALDPSPLVTNVVKVQVTSQDGGSVKTYTVNVARLASLVPPNITNTYSGGNLTLNWPVANTTYRLQSQTNTTSVGLTTNWVNVTGGNLTNKVVIPLDTTKGTVFYRLIYP